MWLCLPAAWWACTRRPWSISPPAIGTLAAVLQVLQIDVLQIDVLQIDVLQIDVLHVLHALRTLQILRRVLHALRTLQSPRGRPTA